MLFLSHMVEDKTQNGLSYVEFLVHIHRHIQNKMAWENIQFCSWILIIEKGGGGYRCFQYEEMQMSFPGVAPSMASELS